MHIKETASATNQIKHGGFSYIPMVSLMNFKRLSSLDSLALDVIQFL